MLAAAIGLALTGCQASGPTTFRYDAERYDDAFRAATETLLDYDFKLERVDGARGVLVTTTKPTAGIATPWDREQSGLAGEWEDFTNRQMRSAEVLFGTGVGDAGTDAGGDAGADAGAGADGAGRVAEVRVTLFRVNRPGQKIETEAIGATSRWFDPAYDPGAPNPSLFLVPLREDRDLASRIAAAVEERLSRDPDASPADRDR